MSILLSFPHQAVMHRGLHCKLIPQLATKLQRTFLIVDVHPRWQFHHRHRTAHLLWGPEPCAPSVSEHACHAGSHLPVVRRQLRQAAAKMPLGKLKPVRGGEQRAVVSRADPRTLPCNAAAVIVGDDGMMEGSEVNGSNRTAAAGSILTSFACRDLSLPASGPSDSTLAHCYITLRAVQW